MDFWIVGGLATWVPDLRATGNPSRFTDCLQCLVTNIAFSAYFTMLVDRWLLPAAGMLGITPAN